MMIGVDGLVLALFGVSSLLLVRWLVRGRGEALQRVRLVGEYFALTLSVAVLCHGFERLLWLPELMHQLTLLAVLAALMVGLVVPVLARRRLARA